MGGDEERKYLLISMVVAVAAFGTFGLLEHPVLAENPNRVLKLYVKEFEIFPPDTYVMAGAVRIMVFNEGTTHHGLAIQGISGTFVSVSAGDVAQMTVNLKEGDYVFYCPRKGHREKGMVGRLKVTKDGWPK